MTEVGKNKLNHPSLGTAGGASLHSQMEGIFTEISNNLPARWKLYSAVANSTTLTFEHNLQVPLSDLRLHIYTSSAGVQTRLTDLTGWTIGATSGYEQSKVDITVPSSGGPFTFYLYISHEPMSDKLNLAGGTLTGNVSLSNSYKITNSADPSSAQDLATKNYVDNVAQGLDVKQSVRVATTANITLSGLQTIDGVGLAGGQRVLVKNQTNQAQNGIYEASNGAWSRAADMTDWSEVPGAFVFVEYGDTLNDTGWVSTTNTISGTVGTTAITWSQFAGVGTYKASGNGIELDNNTGTFSLELDGSTLSVGSNGLKVTDGGISSTQLADGSVDLTGSKITNTLPLSKGGTGTSAANQEAALNALLPSQTGNSGKVLSTDGSTHSWVTSATANTQPPVGAIVAYLPGYFTAAANVGFTAVGPSTNDVSGVNAYLPANWRVCDGTALNNASSPIWNAANRYLPNLTDSRFLQGFNVGGGIGGENTTQHTHSLPAHYHGMGTGATLAISSSGGHNHTVTINEGSGHNHAGLFTADAAYQIFLGTGGTSAYTGGILYNVGGTLDTRPQGTYWSPGYGKPITSTDTTGITASIAAGTGTHTHAAANFTGSIGLVTGGVNGNAAMTSGAAAAENRPAYLNVFYIIRVV